MPSILQIEVTCARDLPIMDRSSELADAFVEVRFGDLESQRTEIARKTLNPTWNHQFQFEVSDDSVLQNEPLEIHVLDYDAISANDAVGGVLIDLDPLLQMDRVGQISGWFPLYDTMRGIRGEIYVNIKLQFFGDANPFKDSSAGVQFFSSGVPECYSSQLLGLVDAMVLTDDPEYHWSDSFRTPRASNEARQKMLFRASGQLRRILGTKALELGGNVVVGMKQTIDFEVDFGRVCVRAYGTACLCLEKRSRVYSLRKKSDCRPLIITLCKFKNVSLGGLVSAKSIKLISQSDTVPIREEYFREIRDEIKSHCETLSCTHVLGYTEKTTTNGDLVVLYAQGTAAVFQDETECGWVHIPYQRKTAPFPMVFGKCSCNLGLVPPLILCTLDQILDQEGVFVTATFHRQKKAKNGEQNAAAVSDLIPFLEFDLNKQVCAKLKHLEMNAIFGLQLEISLSDESVLAICTGTAFQVPYIKESILTDEEEEVNCSKVLFLETQNIQPEIFLRQVYTTLSFDYNQSLFLMSSRSSLDKLDQIFLNLPQIQNNSALAGIQYNFTSQQKQIHFTLFLAKINETPKKKYPSLSFSESDEDLVHSGRVLGSSDSIVRNMRQVIDEQMVFEMEEVIELKEKESIKLSNHSIQSAYSMVEITPLCLNIKPKQYLGRVSLHFVKEQSLESLTNNDAPNSMACFMHLFWHECLSVFRAHVQALGGNFCCSFCVEKSNFSESIKSQAYALCSLSGDACLINKEE